LVTSCEAARAAGGLFDIEVIGVDMSRFAMLKLAPVALLVGAALANNAHAVTQVVAFNVLNASATLPSPLLGGDSLHLNTYVSTQTGALLQTINFTVGANVGSLTGQAVWEIDTATGTGPRLVGVNIDIFNAATNALVTSDSFAGVLGNFAVSTFASGIAPGNYRLVATGTGIRDSSLDVTLNFVAAVVPEPGTYGLMLAGLGLMGLLAHRRRA
jgi:PEP-CTERM motif